MKTELLRHFKSPVYWGVLSAGLLARAALGAMDRRYRREDFWALSRNFWRKTGSVTVAFLILLVLIRLFSLDREKNTQGIIRSTAQGRTRLFSGGWAPGVLRLLWEFAC